MKNHVIATTIIGACLLGATATSHAKPSLLVKGAIHETNEDSRATQRYELNIRVTSFDSTDQEYTVTWYFIEQEYGSDGKNLPEVFKAGEKKISMHPKERIDFKVTSYPLNAAKSGEGGKSGAVFEDYLVVVRQGADFLVVKSHNRKYQSDKWILSARQARSKEDESPKMDEAQEQD